MFYLVDFNKNTKVKSHIRNVKGKKIKVDSYSRQDRARLKGALIGGSIGGLGGLLSGLPYAPLSPAIPVITSVYGATGGAIQGGGIGEYLKQRKNYGKKLGGNNKLSQAEKLERNTQRRIVGGVIGGLTSPLVGIDPISGAILGVGYSQKTRKYRPIGEN